MAYKIGIFSLRSGVGVTATAIHIANYIAGSEKTVALVEYENNIDPIFNRAKTEFREDGTFVANNVHYYPAACKVQPHEDVEVIDFGEVNVLFEFPEDVDKLYLCTDSAEAMSEIDDYLMGVRVNPDIIIFSYSKVDLHEFLKAGYKAIMVGDRVEPRLNYNLAMAISSSLRKGRINPPEYHKNWEYDRVEFNVGTESDKNKRFGLNKQNVNKESALNERKDEDDPFEDSGVSVAKIASSTVSHGLYEYDFDTIPAPTIAVVENETDDSPIKEVTDKEIKNRRNDRPERYNKSRRQIKAEKRQAKIDAKNEKLRLKQEAKKKEKERIRLEREEKVLTKQIARQAKNDAKNAKIRERQEAKAKIREKAKIEKLVRDAIQKDKKRLKKDAANRRWIARSTKGILGKLIKIANAEYENVANIFIVTKNDRIFIFRDASSLFSKLERLLHELRDTSYVSYIVISFIDESSNPIIISETKDYDIGDVYSVLEALDIDLRRNDFSTDDFQRHKELQLYKEVIYA